MGDLGGEVRWLRRWGFDVCFFFHSHSSTGFLTNFWMNFGIFMESVRVDRKIFSLN